MREKITNFSKGVFEYELPCFCLSEEEIRISVEAGKIYSGSLTIHNHMRPMKGVAYSSNRLMKTSFSEENNVILYQFDATNLQSGETIQGDICIISDCGEKVVPFYIQIETAHFITSLGKIKDLFQFANLARMDWSEAKKVFKSENFEKVFLKQDDRYGLVYRNLMKSVSTSQAMEEFLIAIRKKAMIRLEVDRTSLEYILSGESISDKLTLSKDHWGFAEIRVSTDTPFIQLEQKFVWADRFIGNSHQIAFKIDPSFIKKGNHFGHIFIKTAYQSITVSVLAKAKKEDGITKLRKQQKLEHSLLDLYLSFRLNRIELPAYLEETTLVLEQIDESDVKLLMKAYLAIVSTNQRLAEELLAKLEINSETLRNKSMLEYCAYLYLKALYHKDELTIKNTTKMIRNIYENESKDWRILWFLLYIDKEYTRNKNKKLADLKEQFIAGCRSPILYYEAVCIFNEEPVLLRELEEYEIQVLNFGIKNWIVSKEVARQYTYHATKKKNFDPVIFHGLTKLYDEFAEPEILSTICSMLIKGLKRETKYFEWYRLGVQAQLRITELYEYYMYSVPEDLQDLLDQQVLLYFIYNSNLSDRKKAFLYANIVRNRAKIESIYRSYAKKMELFAEKMLSMYSISKDLAVLYKEFFSKNPLNVEVLCNLPHVIYRQELICDNPNMVVAIVVHKELGQEELQPIHKGRAFVDIFSNNVEVFLLDSYGNRYVDSVGYALKPLLIAEEYEVHCLEHSNHLMLLLHLYDRYQSYRIMSAPSVEIRKRVLLIDGLAEHYRTDCYRTLIDYYYENYNDEYLELYLNQIDLSKLRVPERTMIIEFMVVRSFYQKAMEAFQIYGFEAIAVNRLVKLCSGWLMTPEAKKSQELMLSLCYYVFSHGKYDDAILRYLVKYYRGANNEMYKLWNAARDFEIKTNLLEERLLSQMLFTESYNEESYSVFKNYYKNVTNHTLVRGFLSYCAYRYLIYDCCIDSELFPIMKRELNYEKNDLCLIAWLKYYGNISELTENDLLFIELSIEKLVKGGIVLPFFIQYRSKVHLPEGILGKYYISYIADPNKQVYIHYRLSGQEEEQYLTERMKNTFMGIYTKEIMLFYHETIEYYITEEAQGETNRTENCTIRYECDTSEEEKSKYNQMNLMLKAQEVQDEDALFYRMENYIKEEYSFSECFKPITG